MTHYKKHSIYKGRRSIFTFITSGLRVASGECTGSGDAGRRARGSRGNCHGCRECRSTR